MAKILVTIDQAFVTRLEAWRRDTRNKKAQALLATATDLLGEVTKPNETEITVNNAKDAQKLEKPLLTLRAYGLHWEYTSMR